MSSVGGSVSKAGKRTCLQGRRSCFMYPFLGFPYPRTQARARQKINRQGLVRPEVVVRSVERDGAVNL